MFPAVLLLRLRWLAAAHSFSRNPSRLAGSLLALLVAVPAALAAGETTGRQLARLPSADAEPFFGLVLTALQALLLVLLLLPEGTLSLTRAVPASVLRPFPVRPYRLILASALGGLLDLPLLLIAPTLAAVIRHSTAGNGGAAPALDLAALVYTLGTILLLLLQTGAVVQALEHGGSLISRQRRATAGVILSGVLLMAVCFGLPPAFGATAAVMPAQPQPGQKPPAPASSGKALSGKATVLLPSAMAGRGIHAADRRSWGEAIAWLAVLAAVTTGSVWCASCLLAAAMRKDSGTSAASRRSHRISDDEAKPENERLLPRLLPSSVRDSVGQVAALTRVEWHHLTRDPGAHLPLRTPAMLLLAVLLGLVLTNNGPDALANLGDLMGIGSLLYVVFWQVQLLCNRFGSEAGTARLLFGFPLPRHRMLMGKNAALLLVLLFIDGLLLIGGGLSAQMPPQRIAVLLAWLVPVLAAATALGNVVSVLAAFPIREPGQAARREPERGIAFVYVLLCLAVAGILWPVSEGLGRARTVGPVAVAGIIFAAAVYLSLVYTGTLYIAAGLLRRREQRIVCRLDGKE